MRRKSIAYITFTASLVVIFLLAGCKSIRQVEAENRDLPLDLRNPDPYYNMMIGHDEARPVHPTLTREDLVIPLSLRRSIEIALEGHPEIRRWKAKIGEATGRRRELETMGWAELIFDVTWAPDWELGLDDPDTATGDRIGNDTVRLGVALRQPIYFEWQRRRALLNANTEKIKSLYNQMEEEKNKVIADVCKTFLDIMEAQLQCEHRRTVYHLDRKRVAVVRKLVEKRLLLDSALHKHKNLVHAAGRDHYAAIQVLKSRERKLKNLLGIDTRISIKFEPVDFEEIPLIPEEEAYDYMIRKSPLFNALDHDVRKAFWDKEFMRWDDIDSDIIIRYGYDLDGGTKPIDDFLLISWTLRYPLLHVKARNARVVQGLKRMEQFEIEREVNQQAAIDALETHYSAIDENASEIASQEAAVYEARELLRVSQALEVKGSPDESLKSDPENILLSTITTVKLANSEYDLRSAKLDYMREIMGLYATLGRAAELIEYAKHSELKEEIKAFSRSIILPNAQELLDSEGGCSEALVFCDLENTRNIIVDFTGLEENREKIEVFLKEAHSRNINVFLKLGGEEWLRAPGIESAGKQIESFFSYNTPPEPEETTEITETSETAETTKPVKQEWVEPPQKFDGIFLDITGRKLQKPDHARAIEIVKTADSIRKEQEIDSPPVTLLTAIPVAASGDLLGKLLPHADSVALIVDLNDQAEIAALAAPILERAKKTSESGKVKIQINTLPNQPKRTSYAQRESDIFFGEIMEIANKLHTNKNFSGILIEDYPSLRSLMSR